ncbi:MAG TPA: ABC transporter ATP-binding protein [Solirubrobacterales bacterium]|jgi:ABC-2 type transport system ATP-binding protein/ABC-2 type transport system permease protein|nr:ABC transporter ATP-binding protein [Solirubrobacterales bacterium]
MTPTEAAPAFRVVDLVKRHPGQARPANNGMTFQVGAGEVFGIIGGNGAGKTTLIRQMLDLSPPDSGRVELFGQEVRSSPGLVQLHVGYQAQQGSPLPNLPLLQALTVTTRLRGLARRHAEAEAKRLVEVWDLGAFARKPMSQMSGGEQRLGHIALAMAGQPPVLVLDEPTAGLDPTYRRRTWEVLSGLCAAEGTTVVLVTHDAVEAEKIVQRVAVIREGAVAAVGRPGQLLRTLGERLRLEVSFDPTVPPPLPSGLEWHTRAADRFVTLLKPEEVTGALTQIDLTAVDGVRLYSATLEDLYFRYAIS